jgi:hypothetical protein
LTDRAKDRKQDQIIVELVLANCGGKIGRPPGGPPPLSPRSASLYRTKTDRADTPGWADGLRQLYDSVLDETLPESFDDLLKRLDQAGHG